MRRITGPGNIHWWIVFFVLLGFSSCKTTRVVTTAPGVVKPMSTSKLIRNIENNAFEFKHLSIKKIACQFDNGKTKASFRASLQAENEKQITLMLTKLSIPVGRLWLTPDSVKFINYLQENYFLDDYSYLGSLLDMNLDFEMVNAVISNDAFSLLGRQGETDSRDYQTLVEEGMYVLQSDRNSQMDKLNVGANNKKPVRRSKKPAVGASVQQKMYVDPVTFKLRKITLQDAVNHRRLNIDFSDFVEVGNQLYPGEINIYLSSDENKMEMNISLSNFSMQQEKGIRFKVPEKFTRTGHE